MCRIQTFPLPLALCNAHGEMRSCTKSEFRDVILNLFPSSDAIVTQCPLINGNSSNDHELIIDFLFMLHQPPPPDMTFSNYVNYLWNRLILKLGAYRGAKVIRIVVDKPSYLPKPRELLHKSRSSKTGIMNKQDCSISDDGALPHCKAYQTMLANPELKKQYILYLMTKFIELTCSNKLPVHVILDYEGIACPCIIYNGVKFDLPMIQNENEEADYNVWYHCMTSTSQNCIILGSDTDIWVYGMMYKDCGWLGRKTVYVEKTVGAEYVCINSLHVAATSHPQLKQVAFPLLTLATIYILTGGDYVSSFFRTSKQAFINAFLSNIKHINKTGGLVETKSESIMGIEGHVLHKINLDTWAKLVCCVYLHKQDIV